MKPCQTEWCDHLPSHKDWAACAKAHKEERDKARQALWYLTSGRAPSASDVERAEKAAAEAVAGITPEAVAAMAEGPEVYSDPNTASDWGLRPSDGWVCLECEAPAVLVEGVWRHKSCQPGGKPWEDSSTFCDKYGYPINVKPAPEVPRPNEASPPWPVEEAEEPCTACQGRGVQYERLQRDGEWGDYPVPCGCQGPCDPPKACQTHGRCWSHSRWETDEEKAAFESVKGVPPGTLRKMLDFAYAPDEPESRTDYALPTRPTFEEAWKKKEAEGYRYGHDALEAVRLGWEIRDSYGPPDLCDACGRELADEVGSSPRCHRTLGCTRERDHGGTCAPRPETAKSSVEQCITRLEQRAADYRHRAQFVLDDSDRADGEAQDDEAEDLELRATVVEQCANDLRPLLTGSEGK